jgi:hypothetical protein
MKLPTTSPPLASCPLQLHGGDGQVRAEAATLRSEKEERDKRIAELEAALSRTENAYEQVSKVASRSSVTNCCCRREKAGNA